MLKLDLHPDLHYLLAVSGGLDSMALCHLAYSQNLMISVAHCNFNLRGEESDGDEELVRRFCTQQRIPFFSRRFDTEAFASEHKLSIQVAARELRYAWFESLCEKEKIQKILTAHHRDDSIETFLFHACRGTGILGLRGIASEQGNVIRPLLSFSKTELHQYVALHHIPYRTDSSNLETHYTRNAIRLKVMPVLQEIFPNVQEQLTNTIHYLNEAATLYEGKIEDLKKKLLEKRGKLFVIPVLKLKKTIAAQTVLFEILKPYGFSPEQKQAAWKLCESGSGKRLESATHVLWKDRDLLMITALEAVNSDHHWLQKDTLQVDTAVFTCSQIIKPYRGGDIRHDADTCTVDAAKLEYPLLLRTRKTGDYLYPFGMKKKKKISRILIDAKIPMNEKEERPVLLSADKIVWLAGIKADDRFRVTAATKEIVIFKFKKK